MNQLIGIALGGAFGSVLRFLISSGVYQWLGHGFPYGTLSVNLIGSFLVGFFSETLILQNITFSVEYRSAILIGVLGGFTTFSTFSLETLSLLEQGLFNKAGLNILISVIACLFITWLGLLLGRALFFYSEGWVRWLGIDFPYALIFANMLLSFLAGLITAFLLEKTALPLEHRSVIVLLTIGVFTTLSSVYLSLYFIEQKHTLGANIYPILLIFISNVALCVLLFWLGGICEKHIKG